MWHDIASKYLVRYFQSRCHTKTKHGSMDNLVETWLKPRNLWIFSHRNGLSGISGVSWYRFDFRNSEVAYDFHLYIYTIKYIYILWQLRFQLKTFMVRLRFPCGFPTNDRKTRWFSQRVSQENHLSTPSPPPRPLGANHLARQRGDSPGLPPKPGIPGGFGARGTEKGGKLRCPKWGGGRFLISEKLIWKNMGESWNQ